MTGGIGESVDLGGLGSSSRCEIVRAPSSHDLFRGISAPAEGAE